MGGDSTEYVLIIAAVLSSLYKIYTARNNHLFHILLERVREDPLMENEEWSARDIQLLAQRGSTKWVLNFIIQIILVAAIAWAFNWKYAAAWAVVFFFLCARIAKYIINSVGMAESLKDIAADIDMLLMRFPSNTFWQRLRDIVDDLRYPGGVKHNDPPGPDKPVDESKILATATEAIDAEKYKDAITLLSGVIARNPNNFDALVKRGLSFLLMDPEDYKLNQFSLKDLTKAISLQPNNTLAYETRGRYYHVLANYAYGTANESGYCSKALNDYYKVLELNPKSSKAITEVGHLLEQSHKLDEAIAFYQRIVEYIPDDSGIWFLLGRAMGKTNPQKAIEELSMAIKLDESKAIYYATRASVYSKLKQHEKAIGDLTIAIQIQPWSLFYQQRAKAYKAVGRNDLAKQDEDAAKRSHEENIRPMVDD